MKTITTLILAGALALLAQPNQLDLRQDPPTAVQSERVSSAYTGTSGATTYYYWVVTRYPIGFIVPTAPVIVGGASALGGGNSVALGWPAMTGASSYDVLRTTTNAAPSSCTCAVVLATTGTTLTDNGGALSAWPPGGLNSAGVAQAELQINNRDAGSPYITLAVRNAQRILNYQLGILKNGTAPSYVPPGFIQPYSNAQGAFSCVDSNGAECTVAARNLPVPITVADGADVLSALVAAMASLPSTGGEIRIPWSATAYQLSDTLTITKNVTILCGTGAEENAGRHEQTRIVFTGGAVPAISITGTAATGSRIIGCGLGNTGTATVGIDIDDYAGSTEMDHVVISSPTVPFSVAGIRYGHTANVVSSKILDTVVSSAAPVGVLIENVSALLTMERSHIMFNTVANVRLGTATSAARDIQFVNSTFEQVVDRTGIDVVYASKVQCVGCYFESGGTGFAVDIAATAQLADSLEFTGGWFSNLDGSAAISPIRTAFASTDLIVSGNLLATWPNPHYIVTNTASRSVLIEANTSITAGLNVATSLTNVNHYGNVSGGTGIIDPYFQGTFSGGTLKTRTGAITTDAARITMPPTIASGGTTEYAVQGEVDGEQTLFGFQNRTVGTNFANAYRGYQANGGAFYLYNNNILVQSLNAQGKSTFPKTINPGALTCATLPVAGYAAGDITFATSCTTGGECSAGSDPALVVYNGASWRCIAIP